MHLTKALPPDTERIWQIIQQGILRRKRDGSRQWQDGYPNRESVTDDIEKGYGYVLVEDNNIIAYCAAIVNDEPAYDHIEGAWLTNGDFLVVHRVAVADEATGRGAATRLLQLLENVALQHNIFSIKLDTNFDNAPMLKLLQNLRYTYCGEVMLRGAFRKAFEKVLQDN